MRDWVWVAGVATVSAAGAVLVSVTGSGGAAVVVGAAVGVRMVARRRAGQDPPPAVDPAAAVTVARSGRRMWAPLWIAVVWMLGTFAAFWLTGLSAKVEDPWRLTGFVSAATGMFALGYWCKIQACPQELLVPGSREGRQVRSRRLIGWSAAYFIIFGITQMGEYGATGVGDIVTHVQDPGSSYQAKFAVYEQAAATSQVSPVMQVVTLAGGLYGVLCPLLVLYWRRLHLGLRVAGVAGLVTYAGFFLFIGTQKGLGDLIVMVLVGVLAGTLGTWWVRNPTTRQRRTTPYVAAVLVAFVLYMVSAQAGRADQFGSRGVVPPNPTVVRLVGDRTAIGVASVLFYPTHGYLGLAYNLGTDFQWSCGLGSSSVVASYAGQYLGVQVPGTYPVRTEVRTGWPAGMYWATAYPWLASDLTFPGVVLAMGLFGWLFAHMWVRGAMMRDRLALVIFGQLAIAVAYIPANNQLWISRPTTIGFVTLLALYAVRKAFTRAEVRTSASRSGPGTRPPQQP